MIKLDLLHIYDFILELYFFTHFYRSYFPFIQSSMKIMYIFFSYSVHNFNLNKHLVKILFSIKNYSQIFYKVRISTTFKKTKVKLFVIFIALARTDTILPITVLTRNFLSYWKFGHVKDEF